ncbi:MAG: hypothetical protein ACRD2B_03205 [Terriglobia bacterium]
MANLDITIVARMDTVVHNGDTVIDHEEISGITGGALDSHLGRFSIHNTGGRKAYSGGGAY